MPMMAEFGSVHSVSKKPDCLYDVNCFFEMLLELQTLRAQPYRLYIQIAGRVCLSELQGSVLYMQNQLDAIFKQNPGISDANFWVIKSMW